MNTLDYYVNFTIDAFKEFNGKVNKVNSNARLEVMSVDGVKLGKFKYPNIVYIYIDFIMYTYKEDNLIKIKIIESVIHELFHCDQIINLLYYDNDSEYYNQIESSVVFMTYKYINHNWNYIANRFGLDKPGYFESVYEDIINNRYCEYNRISLGDHYRAMIRNYTPKQYANLVDYTIGLLDDAEAIYIIINDVKILIKFNYEFMDRLAILNKTLHEEIIKFDNYLISMDMYQYGNEKIYELIYTVSDQSISPIQ